MAMKTACCGKSLRSVTLILLYFNLIITVWTLFTGLTTITDSTYQQFVDENSNFYFETLVCIIGSLIFLMTIISICQEKPSYPFLTAAIVFLLFEVIHSVLGIILLNSGDGMQKFYDAMIEKDIEKKPESERENLRLHVRAAYPAVVFFVFLVLIAGVAFKLYTAYVFYSYKVDMQGRPAYSVPVRQNAADNEINASAPAGYAQYVVTPGQPLPYPGQTGPVQYPGQILQYPSQPQPYLGQPSMYPSQPPLYPSQPPQYTYESK